MTDKEMKEMLMNYTNPAANRKDHVKEKIMWEIAKKQNQRTMFLKVAMVIAIAGIFLFGVTNIGTTFAKEIVQWILNSKNKIIQLEGEDENVVLTPQAPLEKNKRKAQYIIYIDESRYSRTQDENKEIIKVKNNDTDIDNTEFPDCYMEITQIASAEADSYSVSLLSELKKNYVQAKDYGKIKMTDSNLYAQKLHAKTGQEWNSKIVDYYIFDNEIGGVFEIKVQYFLEAAEGHGVRFSEMLKTFDIVRQ